MIMHVWSLPVTVFFYLQELKSFPFITGYLTITSTLLLVFMNAGRGVGFKCYTVTVFLLDDLHYRIDEEFECA